MHQHKELSFPRLQKLVEEFDAALPPPKKEHQGVLVLGESGSGKTTFISLIAGLKLYVKKMRLNTVIDQIDTQSSLKIRHENMSATVTPVKMTIGNIDFFDCPGFDLESTKELEISYYYFLKKVFKLYTEMKIVLVIEENCLTECRFKRLPGLLRLLKQWVTDLSILKDGVVLVISKTRASKNIEDYIEELNYQKNFNNGGEVFTSEEQDFLANLIKQKRVVLFKGATLEEVGELACYSPVRGFFELIEGIGTIQYFETDRLILNGCMQSLRTLEMSMLESWILKSEEISKCLRKYLEDKAVQGQNKQQLVQQLETLLLQIHDEPTILMSHMQSTLKLDTKDLGIAQDCGVVNFLQELFETPSKCLLLLKQIASTELYHVLRDIERQQYQSEHASLCFNIEGLQAKILKDSTVIRQQGIALREMNEQFERKEKKLIDFGLAREREGIPFNRRLQEKDIELQKMQTMLEKRRIINGSLYEKLCEMYDSILPKLPAVHRFSTQNKELPAQKDLSSAIIALHALLSHIVSEVLSPTGKAPTSQPESAKKYPDIQCPHFLNGGQCMHCIREWKQDKENHQRSKKRQL